MVSLSDILSNIAKLGSGPKLNAIVVVGKTTTTTTTINSVKLESNLD
jgi:hypothetical protein